MEVKDEFFMREAIRMAHNGIQRGQTPFGACLVKDGEVVASGHNRVWARKDITAHAEMEVLRQACRQMGTIDLSGSVIYSTTEPCPMCFAGIHWAGIRRIVFGADIEDARQAGFRELPVRNVVLNELGSCGIDIQGHILLDENRQLFHIWGQRSSSPAY